MNYSWIIITHDKGKVQLTKTKQNKEEIKSAERTQHATSNLKYEHDILYSWPKYCVHVSEGKGPEPQLAFRPNSFLLPLLSPRRRSSPFCEDLWEQKTRYNNVLYSNWGCPHLLYPPLPPPPPTAPLLLLLLRRPDAASLFLPVWLRPCRPSLPKHPSSCLFDQYPWS